MMLGGKVQARMAGWPSQEDFGVLSATAYAIQYYAYVHYGPVCTIELSL
jgi:hypothetical protein